MNAHDSEKVVGTLLEQGYAQVETPEEAHLVLYNTCSIRDKAEQKVFNRLQNFKRAGKGKVFGVLGCVAQQEGEKIFDRAPHVSLVCGSASYTQLRRDAGAARGRATGASPGLSLDTEETFDTPFTRRDNPHRAYITIIEGCDKSCAYCVVPFTRGPERSRTSESVMAEARGLADKGYTEIQLLGQNVNSYRDPSPAGWDFATLLARVAGIPGIRRVRYTTSHPRDFVQARLSTPWTATKRSATTCICRCNRGHRRCWRPWIACTRATNTCGASTGSRSAKRRYALTTDIIVGFPGETEADFDADAATARRSAVRFAVQLQVFAAAQHVGAGDGRQGARRGEAAPSDRYCRRSSAPFRSAATRNSIGRRARSAGGGPPRGAGPVDRPHVGQSHTQLSHPDTRRCVTGGTAICRCG